MTAMRRTTGFWEPILWGEFDGAWDGRPYAGLVTPGRVGGDLGIRRPKYQAIDRSASPCLSRTLGI